MREKKQKGNALVRRLMAWLLSLGASLLKRSKVRGLLTRLKKVVLPGCKGVPAWDIIGLFFDGISNGKLWLRAKGLAYSFLVAIPPLLIFMVTLIAYLPVQGLQDVLLEQLRDLVPYAIYHRIEPTIIDVMSYRHSSLLSLGFFGSIILATNGMYGMMMSLNYGNEGVIRRPFLQRYGVCLLLVGLLSLLILLVVLLQVGYKYILSWLITSGTLVLNPFTQFLIGFVRWVILAFFALTVLGTIYYLVPDKRQRVGFFSSGTVIATLLLFGLTWGFQIYLNNFNQYNLLYGSIGTLLLVMLWIFLNCLVLLVGYEINIDIQKGHSNSQEEAAAPSAENKLMQQ